MNKSFGTSQGVLATRTWNWSYYVQKKLMQKAYCRPCSYCQDVALDFLVILLQSEWCRTDLWWVKLENLQF